MISNVFVVTMLVLLLL